MARILTTQFTQGSLIEKESGAAMTLTAGAGGLIKTSKGIALNGDGAATKLTVTNTKIFGTGDYGVSFSFLYKGTESGVFAGPTNAMNFYIRANGSIVAGKTGVLDQTVVAIGGVLPNIWYNVVINRIAGVYTSYVNNVLNSTGASTTDFTAALSTIGARVSNSFFNGQILNLDINDTGFSEVERNKIYADFLASKSLGKQKRGFKYIAPTDLGQKVSSSSLSAAYNMSPINNKLIDISNNGNDGTLFGPVVTTQNGLRFNGLNTKVTTASAVSAIDITKDYSIFLRFKAYDATTEQIILSNSSALNNRNVIAIQSSTIRCGNYNATLFRGNQSNAIIANQWYDLEYVWDATSATATGYLNGVAMTGTTGPSSLSAGTKLVLGCASNETALFFNGEIGANVEIYGRKVSLQEIKDYHNRYASRLESYECFCDAPADGVTTNQIPNWNTISGTWKIGELTTDSGNYGGLPKWQKYLENVTAGIIAVQSEPAYGTFEFDLYKGADANTMEVRFIADRMVNTGVNGYRFQFTSSETMTIQKYTAGTPGSISFSAFSGLAFGVWYRVRITRTKAGLFTLLVKGGSLSPTAGYDGWTLGGTATDNTFVNSGYISLEVAPGDRITNLKVLQDIIIL